MANRNFNRRQALEKEVKDLYMKVSIGSSGAPTAVSKYGIASIARNSAGDYTITLEDKYASLKYFEVIHLASSAQDLNYQIVAEDVLSAKTIRFLCLTSASATDPASGSTLLIKIEVKNTTVV